MKTKFKDLLLYTLACVGAVSLLLSATQPQQTTSPESHVWQATEITPNGATYLYNKRTGEIHYVKIGNKTKAY